jgi:hypothetical protein
MGNRDHLERNIERLLRAIRPELELPEDKKEEILANLAAEAAAISSKDSAGPSSKTALIQHPVKLAAAAALIIGICAGAIWLLTSAPRPQEQLATQPKDRMEETLPDKEESETTPVVQKTDTAKAASEIDLKRLAAMFDTGNIKGLTAKLSDEVPEVRIAAANYLAQIGEFATVEPLLNAGKEWTGPEADNPFVNAIYQIMLRMSRQQAQVVPEKEQQEPNEPRKPVSPTITAKEPTKPTKETVTYSGIVTNEASEPIEDVYVRSISHNEYYEPSGTEAEGWTDESGQFQIGPIDISDQDKVDRMLIFDHPDYAIGWFSTRRGQAPKEGLEIKLIPPSVVAGIATDEQGNPVEGAVVEASLKLQLQPDGAFHYLTMAQAYGMALITDSDGYFAFEKIPDKARLHLLVNNAGYAPYSTRIEYDRTFDFPIRAGQDDLVITLKPGGFIRGRLVINGKPYETEGVAIFIKGQKSRSVTRTDQTGQFETTGLAEGNYVIQALSKEFEKEDLISRILTDVSVVVGEEPTQVELTLSNPIPITVKVIDEQTGKPVKNIKVKAAPQTAKNILAAYRKSDTEGQCILKVNPGEYVIKAQGWMNGGVHDFSEDVQVGADDKNLSITIAITPRDMISGLLIDTEGKPVAGTVSLGRDSATTDMEGKFELPEPWGDEMEFHVGFAFDQARQIGRAFFWQKSDDINNLVLILEPMAIITGRVVFQDGTSADQAKPKLWIRMPGGGWQGGGSKNPWKLNIIGSGEFEFENIPIGLEMDVHVERPDSEGMAEIGSIVPGETIDVGDILLKALPGFEDTQAVIDSNDLDIQTTYDANATTAQ